MCMLAASVNYSQSYPQKLWSDASSMHRRLNLIGSTSLCLVSIRVAEENTRSCSLRSPIPVVFGKEVTLQTYGLDK
jgi:hypothetical protein